MFRRQGAILTESQIQRRTSTHTSICEVRCQVFETTRGWCPGAETCSGYL